MKKITLLICLMLANFGLHADTVNDPNNTSASTTQAKSQGKPQTGMGQNLLEQLGNIGKPDKERK